MENDGKKTRSLIPNIDIEVLDARTKDKDWKRKALDVGRKRYS